MPAGEQVPGYISRIPDKLALALIFRTAFSQHLSTGPIQKCKYKSVLITFCISHWGKLSHDLSFLFLWISCSVSRLIAPMGGKCASSYFAQALEKGVESRCRDHMSLFLPTSIVYANSSIEETWCRRINIFSALAIVTQFIFSWKVSVPVIYFKIQINLKLIEHVSSLLLYVSYTS